MVGYIVYTNTRSRDICGMYYNNNCQNLGAASSNRVRTSQDTMDVDSVLGNIREERK